jgi:PIN domain nuclease of toxin-antitoxin system
VKRTILDTECWLWWHLSPDRLNNRALTLFEDRRSPLLLSAASSWEIAIKVALGKLDLPTTPERVPEQLAEDGIDAVAIEHAHALAVASLPPYHADPFDRLLIAQARLERCALLTADPQLAQYDVELVWAGRADQPRPKPRRHTRPRRSGANLRSVRTGKWGRV